MLSNNYNLPYRSLPPDKAAIILSPIREGLLDCDFSPAAIRKEHIFTATGNGLCVHQAAFTHPERQDVSTSGMNYYYNIDGLPEDNVLKLLAFSGAPFSLIGNDAQVSLYLTMSETSHERVGGPIPYDRLPELLANYRTDISPQRIYRAKQGWEAFVAFPTFRPSQLRLFAVEVTRDLIVEQFSLALQALRQPSLQTLTDLEITEAAIQLLAAVILAHKGKLGDENIPTNVSLDSLFQEAHHRFSRYFKPELIQRCGRLGYDAYQILQQVNFSSFVIDYLEDIYVKAYPDKKKRQWEGRYNTPLFLTQRILANIPLETIPPENRVVVDMTCGVGNFLQAAYERLYQIADMQSFRSELREHILGNDKDPLTAMLASMSLLLTSYTDHWQVDTMDALQWQPSRQPTIIVGNPPFGGNRKLGKIATTLDESTGERRRYEKANAFLERAIQQLAPGGYLAMVMPQTFVASEAGPQTRKMLLEQCDVFEIWELSGEIFSDASVQPMVIFAQLKKEECGSISPYPVRVRTAQRKTTRLFREEGVFTSSGLANSQMEWGAISKRGPRTTNVMEYKFILAPHIWETIIQHTQRLDAVANITQGAIASKNQQRWRWKEYEYPQKVNWLNQGNRSIPFPYLICYSNDTVIYPNELEEPRKNHNSQLDKEYLLANDKVLIKSVANPSWGQRVIVAIERLGYYPSNSFWVIAPKAEANPHITLEVLAAVVSWYVSNAWIIEHLKAPKISSFSLSSVPFPHNLSFVDCEELGSAVRQLEIAARDRKKDLEAQQVIDHILKIAYNLDDAVYQRLKMVPEWNKFNVEQLRKPLPNPAKLLLVSGGVETVNAQEGTITLWLNGFPGLQVVPIDEAMPGWMLRPGATFRAYIPQDLFYQQHLENVKWFHIVPQEYTYLCDEGLVEQLGSTLLTLLPH